MDTAARPLTRAPGSSEIPSLTEPLGPVSSSQPPLPTACSLDLLTEGIASV